MFTLNHFCSINQIKEGIKNQIRNMLMFPMFLLFYLNNFYSKNIFSSFFSIFLSLYATKPSVLIKFGTFRLDFIIYFGRNLETQQDV